MEIHSVYLEIILRIWLWCVGLITYPIVLLMNIGYKKTIPPITNPILLRSAKKLAHQIRTKELKSLDVVKAYIARCEESNPIINAIVETRYEQALQEAIAADEIIMSGKYSTEYLENHFPLLGIPFTVKETIAVEGLRHNAGIYKEKIIPAPKNAECILLMKAAGAIPLLVSNTPELGFGYETYNYVTGTTRNPYDSRRTSGGSSGGEAALLASGASVIGLGSDSAGSLRLPAMYNGIFSHKPTSRSISSEGHIPTSDSELWFDNVTVGPMTRYAEDLPLMLKILNSNQQIQIHPEKQVPLKTIKLYYMDSDGSWATSRINKDVRNAFKKIVDHFEKTHGKSVIKVQMKYLKHGFEVATKNLLRPTVDSIYEKPIKLTSVLRETFKKILGLSKFTSCAILYGYPFILYNKYLTNVDKVVSMNDKMRWEFSELLQDDGVCFYPTFISSATYHYDYARHFFDFIHMMIFSSLGLPVTSCPISLTKKGMPIGVQIVVNRGCDHLGLIVAKELEDAFGGWVQPNTKKHQ